MAQGFSYEFFEISKNLHWNLSFCFQRFLFILKSVIDKVLLQYYIAMFFIHQHRLRKCYMQTFSGQDLLLFACAVSFLFIYVLQINVLTFYDFLLLLYAVFYPLIQEQLTWKNAKIGEIERLELKIFFAAQPSWAASS